jgi:transcriptional regulator with XRE-family HTH domain
MAGSFFRFDKEVGMNRPRFNGKFMRKMRKIKNLTLQQVADRANTSKSYVWECEKLDGLEPSGAHVFKLAKVLECKMEDFYR